MTLFLYLTCVPNTNNTHPISHLLLIFGNKHVTAHPRSVHPGEEINKQSAGLPQGLSNSQLFGLHTLSLGEEPDGKQLTSLWTILPRV